jgi:hypothetical protein
MGIVYDARQISLNRKVALKVLSTSIGMTTKAVIRFRRDAAALFRDPQLVAPARRDCGSESTSRGPSMEGASGPLLFVMINVIPGRQDGSADNAVPTHHQVRQ